MAPAPLRSNALPVAVVLSLLLSGTGGVAAAAAPQPTAISSCTTITSPGQYVLTADIRDSDASTCLSIEADGVTLDGNGHTVDGVDREGTYGVLVGGSGARSGVAVENLVVTDWGTGIRYQDATDGELVSVTSNNNHLAGIRLIDTTNTVIRGSRVAWNGVGYDGYYGDGILLKRGAGNAIRNVVAENNSLDGIRIRRSARNTVRGVVSAHNQRHGILLEVESHDNTVRNSQFDANDRDGMTIRRGSSDNRLVGNSANDNGHDSNDGDGAEVLGSDGNLLRGNVMRGNPDDGIALNHGSQHNRVVGNDVSANARAGILVRIDSGDNWIARNRIVDHTTGILVEGTADDPTTNRVGVIDNRVVDSDRFGVRVEGGRNHTVVLNTVRGSGAGGVLLAGTTRNLVWSNRAADNDGDGVVLSSAPNNRLGNNSLVGNDRYGVALSGSDSNRLVMNEVRRNGAGGVELVSSDHNQFLTGDVRSNAGDGVDVLDSDDNRIARNTFADNRDLSVFVHGDSSNNDVRNNDDAGGTHTLTVRGSGEWSRYGFVVTGDVTGTSRTEDGDTVAPETVWGGIVGGTDAYTFTGAVANLWTTGDATVLVDGNRVDPAEYGASELVVEGNDGWSRYRFATDGRVIRGSNLEPGDALRPTSVSGGIAGGIDTYDFAGGYTELVVDGDATVRVDGRRLHASARGGSQRASRVRNPGSGSTTNASTSGA